ncbi:MAG: uroporphyrinogen-III synthase [Opitutales bacterium]|nr:uroporphyrinogen-III synthase [Opitutales bacterium]
MAKPKSKRVLLTRADNSAVSDALASRGVETVSIPLVKISLGAKSDDASDIFEEMGRYDWITFSSANGVRGFFGEFLERFDDIRSLGLARIACVGEATARELGKYHLRADVVPAVSTAADMARAVAEYETIENLKILCVIGNLAGNELFEILEKHNAIVDELEVYTTTPAEVDENSPEAGSFREHGADVVVFASPSAVDSFAKNAEKLALSPKAAKPKIVAIGAKTAAAVEKYGMKVAAVAASPFPEDIADAVCGL